MKLIRNKYTLSFNQVALMKLAAACIGIAVGAYWGAFFIQYL